MPEKPDPKPCTTCGHPAAETRWERGVIVYEPHSRWQTSVYCERSNRPVTR